MTANWKLSNPFHCNVALQTTESRILVGTLISCLRATILPTLDDTRYAAFTHSQFGAVGIYRDHLSG